jgi:hypothetical protein
LYYNPNSITYDPDTKKILVSDYENKRFRIIKNLNIVATTPYISNYTTALYDINKTVLLS